MSDNNKIKTTPPLGVIFRSPTAVQPGIKRKLTGPELAQLEPLESYLAALNPKFPNRVVAQFEWRWESQDQLIGFQTDSKDVADALQAHLNLKATTAEPGKPPYCYDMKALARCVASYQQAMFAKAVNFNLGTLTNETTVQVNGQPRKLMHLIPDKLPRLLALKVRLGEVAAGLTFYVTPDAKTQHHLGGFSVHSEQAYDYLCTHHLVQALEVPVKGSTYRKEWQYPDFKDGQCYGQDALQLLMTQIQGHGSGRPSSGCNRSASSR